MAKKILKTGFPEGFYWGASTSAHQVEGGNTNDWSVWERENSARLAKEALSKSYPGHVLNDYPGPLRRENYVSGASVDHYGRYEEDFNIAKSLGHNAHRFSIEWSRIEPKEGEFSEREIEHYRKVINALRARGVEPFITLWHFTNPIWIKNIGGWTNKKTAFFFVRFAEKMVKEFGDVKFWLTINEPMIYAGKSFLQGTWPPACRQEGRKEKSLLKYIRVLNNFSVAHKKAYEAVKKVNRSAQVGIAKNNIYFEGKGLNAVLANLADWWWNERFLDDIKDHQDFIGLNYYFHNRVKGFKFNQNENKKISDMGWEIYPEGIYRVLQNLAKYKKPIYITENGMAEAKDEKRADFIRSHLKWVNKAIKDSIDIRGYFYWSLLDNFEWDKGFWPRFGLLEVDHKTLERKIRESGLKYRDIILGKDKV